MADIRTYPYTSETFLELKKSQYGNDWPVIYILQNSLEMYVGETGDASSRFKQHFDKPERRSLTTAHVIADDEYNKSATLDIESRLIEYFAADNTYKLQNGNGGLSNHNYYDRERYSAKFEIIWKQLQEKGIAHKDLLQLRNTDLFKYSPYKALTEEQHQIVQQIHDFLEVDINRTYIINGDPGTGKSVLAVYLAKYLLSSEDTINTKLALVIPMTSLRKTLKKVFANVRGLKSSMVIGPGEVAGNHYDLLIVDEAHRLRRRVNLSGYGSFDKVNKHYKLGNEGTQLDWIMRASDSQVLLYDSNQSVMPGDIKNEQVAALDALHFKLTSQLRINAGGDYVKFIEDALAGRGVNTPKFKNYEFRYFDDISEMVNEVKKKDKEHGLARLVAGYAWTWETKKKGSQDYDIKLDGLKLRWNSTNIDWVNSKNAVDEVGCIHTVQGYDLNYVGVIIGPELGYDPTTKRLIVDIEKYKDFNGRRSIESTGELEKYILNIYKTLLTRGIKGTFLHAVDEHLASYLGSKF